MAGDCYSFEEAPVPSHTSAVTPSVLARFQQRLGIVEHDQAASPA
jgi:hypothetical protein